MKFAIYKRSHRIPVCLMLLIMLALQFGFSSSHERAGLQMPQSARRRMRTL